MRKTIAALALGIILGSAAAQINAAIPITAMDPTPGSIVGQVNTYLGNFLSASTTGTPSATTELQFFQSGSWATNSNTATTMTSLGPQGASTTVSKWLTVKDNTGNPVFIPAYACGSSACR